ncbi:uncharacterized protein DS421_1g17660 [Arachis hypogaea]|nr:uncharacterized protein DS421_1g17660 [Arachis hypogaea]
MVAGAITGTCFHRLDSGVDLGGRGLPSPFLSRLRITCGCLIKIVSLNKFSSLLIGFQALVVIKVLELGF